MRRMTSRGSVPVPSGSGTGSGEVVPGVVLRNHRNHPHDTLKPTTLTDRVVELFKRNPNVWLRERRIMQAGGWCGFRSRITDARKRGLDIINKTWRETGPDGVTYTCSAYMYRPADLLEIAEGAADSTTEAAC